MRVRGIVAILLVSVAGLGAVTGERSDPPAPEPAVFTAAVTVEPGNMPDPLAAMEAVRDAYYADVQRQIDEYLAWRHEQDLQEAAAAKAAAAPPPTVWVSSGPNLGSCNGDVECFLACTIAHESASAGVYNAVSPGGTYRGAYQFDQSTWNNAVARAGHPEYVGVPPNAAPPEIQDAAATWLYLNAGNRPWGGRC